MAVQRRSTQWQIKCVRLIHDTQRYANQRHLAMFPEPWSQLSASQLNQNHTILLHCHQYTTLGMLMTHFITLFNNNTSSEIQFELCWADSYKGIFNIQCITKTISYGVNKKYELQVRFSIAGINQAGIWTGLSITLIPTR